MADGINGARSVSDDEESDEATPEEGGKGACCGVGDQVAYGERDDESKDDG